MTTTIESDAVIEVTMAVCECLLGDVPHPVPADVDASSRMSALVSISGAWAGDVEVRLTPGLARRLAREVLQVEPRTSDDPDVRDVVGEVANMIGGNLKALLPEPCHLSLPHVELAAVPGRAPDLVQGFVIGDERFEVAVLQAA